MKFLLDGKVDNIYCSRALDIEYKEKAMHDYNALFPSKYRELPNETVMAISEMEWMPLSEIMLMFIQEGEYRYDVLPISVQKYLKRALTKNKYRELMIDFFVDVCFLMIVCLFFLYTEVSVPSLFFGCAIAGGFCFVEYVVLTW